MRRNRRALAGLAGLFAIGLVAWMLAPAERERPSLGLVTSLPLLWSRADVGAEIRAAEIGAETASRHPALAVIEAEYRVVALDTLAFPGGVSATPDLARLDRLLLAQPPALAPADLVALDNWVRSGGSALIIADPVPASEVAVPLGDARAAQSPASIAPLLARWGLVLRAWPEGIAAPIGVAFDEGMIPLGDPGRFEPYRSGHDAVCTIAGRGIIARCRIGEGRALLLADSALFDRGCPSGLCREAITSLLNGAF